MCVLLRCSMSELIFLDWVGGFFKKKAIMPFFGRVGEKICCDCGLICLAVKLNFCQ